jgi:hypothetical protein
MVSAYPETSSRCSMEIFRAANNFELANYPLLDGLGGWASAKYLTSCVFRFRVGGYDWTIRFYFYPDGENEKNCAGNVSAFLHCSSEANCIKTKFTLNMF